MKVFKVLFNDERSCEENSFRQALDAGKRLALADETFGIETPRGGARYFIKRGSVCYPISLRAAANEVAMQGGSGG